MQENDERIRQGLQKTLEDKGDSKQGWIPLTLLLRGSAPPSVKARTVFSK